MSSAFYALQIFHSLLILLHFVQQLECVDFRFHSRLTEFHQDQHGVTCLIKNAETGQEEEIRTQYLLACYVGLSMVRENLGITLGGHADMAEFISIYFKAPDFMTSHKFGNANIYFPQNMLKGSMPTLDTMGKKAFFPHN